MGNLYINQEGRKANVKGKEILDDKNVEYFPICQCSDINPLLAVKNNPLSTPINWSFFDLKAFGIRSDCWD